MKINNPGVLYIVATPIGNLQDITFRAISILKEVDLIAAEDTRHSRPLLQHYSIATPVISLHEHNEEKKSSELIRQLEEGKSIALISDAGTPLISDPGYQLVKLAKEKNLKVVPIPGPSAMIAALSASGLATDRFIFEGFLPAKSKARTERLEHLKNEMATLVFYEAPHRIMDFLNDAEKVFGAERKVVLARELTKMFETIHSASLAELIHWVKSDKNQERGEIVILVEGAKSKEKVSSYSAEKVLQILLEALPLKQAAELASKITGERKNELYQLGLQLKVKKQ